MQELAFATRPPVGRAPSPSVTGVLGEGAARPSIVEDVVAQYASDAPFLWVQRERASEAPHYALESLADLDERLDAHVDGLRLAGEAGWRLCEAVLGDGRAGEVHVAGILAFESGQTERIERVLTAARFGPDVYALAAALGWQRLERVKAWLSALVASTDPALQRLGIAAHALQRADPGVVLRRAMDHSDVALRAQALNAAGDIGRDDLLPVCRQHVDDDDEHCRFAAARSAVRLGERSDRLAETLWACVERGGEHAEAAVRTVMRAFADGRGRSLLADMWARGSHPRLVAIGIGALGDSRLLGSLAELMGDRQAARAAGEAFSTITGVDLASAGLAGDEPPDFRSGPTDDPEDDHVALDPDEHLDWPAPERIVEWYREHQGAFQAGRRYLCGKPIAPNGLAATLAHANQRQRAAAALELALLSPAQPMFDVRAHARVQRRRLREWMR